MKPNKSALFACAALALAGCGTPAGTGAATGAAAGAIVGGPIGAAAGAAGGAIIGAAVGVTEVHKYPAAPRGGYPVAMPADRPGFVLSPYTRRLYDVRAVPHGALVHDVDANKLFRNP
jgi:osmotically inducible lipoprotein OsmB